MDPDSEELNDQVRKQCNELLKDCNTPSEVWVDDEKPVDVVTLVGRNEWGARPPRGELPKMPIPSANINLTLENNFGPCRAKEECISKLKQCQNFFMDQMKMPDIPYSFIVGNDGNVYEGRGWQSAPQEVDEGWKFKENTLDIALLGGTDGDFCHSDGVDQRVQTAKDFVLEGIEKLLILKEYGVDGYERQGGDEYIR